MDAAGLLVDELKRGLAVAGLDHAIAEFLKHVAGQRADARLIVHHQHGFRPAMVCR